MISCDWVISVIFKESRQKIICPNIQVSLLFNQIRNGFQIKSRHFLRNRPLFLKELPKQFQIIKFTSNSFFIWLAWYVVLSLYISMEILLSIDNSKFGFRIISLKRGAFFCKSFWGQIGCLESWLWQRQNFFVQF